MSNKNIEEILFGIFFILILFGALIYSKGWFDSTLVNVEKRHASSPIEKILLKDFKSKLASNKTNVQFENFEKYYSGKLVSWSVKVGGFKSEVQHPGFQ